MFALLRSLFGFESDSPASLAEVRALSWRQFEWLVREGFRRRGYRCESGDADGVDLVLRKDAERLLVQCRQWKSPKIGLKPLRELHDMMTARDAAGGVFIAIGTYTDDARRFARQAGIDLIDGRGLEQLFLDARRPEPFLDPTEGRRRTSFKTAEVEPTCPACSGAMVRRTAVHGTHKGRDFWGCLQAPQCRGTRDI